MNLTAKELRAHLDACEAPPLLMDVREPFEFEICRLEDAVLIPMGQITTVAPTLERDRETVVICHHGVRSLQVCAYLEQLGFSRLINLSGGMAAWSRDVDPTVPTY